MSQVRSAQRRPTAERIARAVLRVEDADPQALLPMQGSLLISALRCMITYAIVPAMAPVISGFGILARPLSLLLSALAAVMAVTSLRRVWMADWRGKWGYTAFAGVVLVLLCVVMVIDVRAVLASGR